MCACPKKFYKNERKTKIGKREERCFMKSERIEGEEKNKGYLGKTKDKGQEKREKVSRKS